MQEIARVDLVAVATNQLCQSRSKGSLSAREREVLVWIASGKTSADIALLLGLSEHTIKHHIKRAMHKLNAATRAHAVAKAILYKQISVEL